MQGGPGKETIAAEGMGRAEGGARAAPTGLGRGDGNVLVLPSALLQPRAMRLPGTKTSAHQPGKARPLRRHRFINDGIGCEADPPASVEDAIEEILVLPPAFPKFLAEAQLKLLHHLPPEQHIAGIGGADRAIDPDRGGGMEIAPRQPWRRVLGIERLDRSQHGIPLAGTRFAPQGSQPIWSRYFVIVQESDPGRARMIETGIARDGNIVGRCVHIIELYAQRPARFHDARAHHGVVRIVGDDHSQPIGRNAGLLRHLPQQFDDLGPLVAADAKINQTVVRTAHGSAIWPDRAISGSLCPMAVRKSAPSRSHSPLPTTKALRGAAAEACLSFEYVSGVSRSRK